MLIKRSASLFAVTTAALVSGQQSAYTVPGAFPTSLYSEYYNNPTATSAQPQPVISDPVTVSVICQSRRVVQCGGANLPFSAQGVPVFAH